MWLRYFEITSIQIKVFKVYLHINSYKRPYTTSKLDQFVTAQCSVVINNHAISIHTTTRIYDGSWANSDTPLFRG